MTTLRRPFRFGVQIHQADSANDWKERARKAEALGFDVLVISDHFGGGFAYGPALAMAAAVTSKLRFGTLVLQNPLRHPALVAQEAATLDLLSDGRFELGIGAGGSDMRDYEQTGIPFDPPGKRAGQLEESIQVIKALFRDEPLTFNGRFYHFSEFESFPRPLQRPAVPLLIAAGGARLLRMAAREADIVSILPLMLPQGGAFRLDEFTDSAFHRKVELIAADAGARFEKMEINMLVQRLSVTDHPEQVAEQIGEHWRITPDEVLASPYALLGTEQQIVDLIIERREQLEISYYVVFERDLDAFAPIVARLKGR
ncbi:MAG TPA: TIGR03621 family F420-dependent LLM class oxidoreductase [Nitrolancea sp.]|nr:TIGR03621 family F420-dependent LLM class oxidoreductase [Nitrolancea sp.]